MLEHHRRHAVHAGDGRGLGFAVFDTSYVADANRMSLGLPDDDVRRIQDSLRAAARPQRE